MGTYQDTAGRYAVVCDDCGYGLDTHATTQRDAINIAAMAGWAIDYPGGPELCAICYERREVSA